MNQGGRRPRDERLQYAPIEGSRRRSHVVVLTRADGAQPFLSLRSAHQTTPSRVQTITGGFGRPFRSTLIGQSAVSQITSANLYYVKLEFFGLSTSRNEPFLYIARQYGFAREVVARVRTVPPAPLAERPPISLPSQRD